jgi:hypothetical protein
MQREQLAARLVLRRDPVLDVGPVEARHEVPAAARFSRVAISAWVASVAVAVSAIAARRPALVQLGERQVVGPEVVAPLGHAVRLVDGEQRDPAALQQRRGRRAAQPFRGQVQQVDLAGDVGRLHRAALVGALGGVEEPGPHPERAQRVDLVLHQRDQR